MANSSEFALPDPLALADRASRIQRRIGYILCGSSAIMVVINLVNRSLILGQDVSTVLSHPNIFLALFMSFAALASGWTGASSKSPCGT